MPYSPCDDLPDHTVNECDDQELGRVRSIAIIKHSLTIADPTNSEEWDAGILAGAIIIINNTNGSYDGGKAKDGAGFGDAESTYMGSEHSLKYNDPTFKENATFYNTLRRAGKYKLAFRTESQIHMVEAKCSFRPIAPVKDDLNSTVVWEVESKWSHPDSPVPYDMPTGIFDVEA